MADVRIKDLPTNGSPSASQYVPTDLAATEKLTIETLVFTGRPTASQAEAEAGTQATKAMTPLTTAQAINALALTDADVPAIVTQAADDAATAVVSMGIFATSVQGAKADSALQPGAESANVDYNPGITGVTTPYISARDKLRQGVTFSDAKCVGDGTTDNAGNIQQLLDDVFSWGGGSVRVNHDRSNGGFYRVDSSVNLKSDVSLFGDGKETSRINGSGNFPTLQFLGGPGNSLRRPIIRDMQIRGGGTGAGFEKAFAIFLSWSGGVVLENLDIRAARLGIYSDYGANIRINNVDLTGCYDGVWFGPLDQVLYPPTPDNTTIMTNVAAYATIRTGLRCTGMTGMKALGCFFLNGETGVHTGEYVPADEPLVILNNGDTSKVPTVADARTIRFFHMTNCFTDSNSKVGWRLRGLSSTKPLTDAKFVNVWGGNISTAAGSDQVSFDVENFADVVYSGSIQTYVGAQTVRFANGSDLTIGNSIFYGHDRLAAGAAALQLNNVDGFEVTGISGSTIYGTATSRAEAHVLRATDCSNGAIVGVVGKGVPAVDLVNTVRTSVVACSTDSIAVVGPPAVAAPPAVREVGTSNANTIIGCLGAGGVTVIGASTVVSASGTVTAKRTSIQGGSAGQPSLYLSDSPTSGFYRFGTSGLMYSFNGVATWGLADDSGNARPFMVLPTYADNAAAVTAGLGANRLYKTATGEVRIRV